MWALTLCLLLWHERDENLPTDHTVQPFSSPYRYNSLRRVWRNHMFFCSNPCQSYQMSPHFPPIGYWDCKIGLNEIVADLKYRKDLFRLRGFEGSIYSYCSKWILSIVIMLNGLFQYGNFTIIAFHPESNGVLDGIDPSLIIIPLLHIRQFLYLLFLSLCIVLTIVLFIILVMLLCDQLSK